MAISCNNKETNRLAQQSAAIRDDQGEKQFKKALFTDPDGVYYTLLDPKSEAEEYRMYELLEFKNILSVQLPKMPTSYTLKLLVDGKNSTMLIKQRMKTATGSSQPNEFRFRHRTVGGVMFREFPEVFMAEIVFLAINPDDQCKGYGQRLMAALKDNLKTRGFRFVVTYADNLALDFFRKIGFSNQLTTTPEMWAKYIKDYDDATLMECVLLDVDYRGMHQHLSQMHKLITQVAIVKLLGNVKKNEGLTSGVPSREQSEQKLSDRLKLHGSKLCMSGVDLEEQLELLSKRARLPTREELNRGLLNWVASDSEIGLKELKQGVKSHSPRTTKFLNQLNSLVRSESVPSERAMDEELLELVTVTKQQSDFGSQLYQRAEKVENTIEAYNSVVENCLSQPLLLGDNHPWSVSVSNRNNNKTA